MKSLYVLILSVFWLLSGYGASAQSLFPQVLKKGKPYTGKAKIKMALVDGKTTIWSNDGTAENGEEPQSSVEINVKDGYFSVLSADVGMKTFFKGLFTEYPRTEMVVWLDLGKGFYLLGGTMLANLKYKEDNVTIKKDGNIYENPSPLLGQLSKDESQEEKEKYNESLLPPEEFIDQRPKENRDFKKLLKAKQDIAQLPVPKAAGIWNWEWIGPGNIGGRIRSILIKPNEPNSMLVGSVSGGIWKSTNSGASWAPVGDFLPNLSISSLVFDPQNVNTVYAGTSEWTNDNPGMGIFVSYDFGSTWAHISSTANDTFIFVTCMVHHPTHANELYAGTWDGVYRTTDGGGTWTRLISHPGSVGHPVDMDIHPTNFKIVYGTSNGYVYTISTSGPLNAVCHSGTGTGLIQSYGNKFTAVAFARSSSTVMYASVNTSQGQIWRYNGSSWECKSTGKNYLKTQGYYDNVIWVSPLRDDFVVVGGIDIWRSFESGDDLEQISDWHCYHNHHSCSGFSAHADNHVIVEHPGYNESSNAIVYVGNDGGIQRANNIGTVDDNSGWVNLANNLGITQFYHGAASNDMLYVIGGTQDNSYLTWLCQGNSGTWYQHETGDAGGVAIDRAYGGAYVATNFCQIKYGGANGCGTDRYSGLTDAGNEALAPLIATIEIDPWNPDFLLAGTKKVWRTNNGGAGWNAIFNPGIAASIDGIGISPNYLWVGYTNGNIYRANQASETSWTQMDIAGMPNVSARHFAFNPQNENQMIAVFDVYDSANVWMFDDAANPKWRRISGSGSTGLPPIPMRSVAWHPHDPNWIYVGSDLGIFASEDMGQTWRVNPRYAANDGPVYVEIRDLFWQQDYLIAATFGRGMFRCLPYSIIYVDCNYNGNELTMDGTQYRPFKTIARAMDVAYPGAIISIKGCTYNEAPINLDKRVNIVIENGPVNIE